MKLYDCFMYFNEDLALELRLNTLNDFIDGFIIAEATRNHSGERKKLNFNINNFQKFKKKINYVVVDDIPKDIGEYKKDWSDAHIRDQFQRNALSRGYKNCNDEDLIMISDLDEIPNPQKIKEFNIKNKYACFMQKNLHLKINLLNISSENWMGTKICQKKNLRSPQWLRNIKIRERPFWKFYKPQKPQLIFNGGWHFNNCLKTSNDIAVKIKSGAHQEENKEEFTNLEKIEEKLKNNTDLFGREFKYKKIELDESFPEYILRNKTKFNPWII